jgi:hypothetical protein
MGLDNNSYVISYIQYYFASKHASQYLERIKKEVLDSNRIASNENF